MKLTAYIDGASRGNPGRASVGVVFMGPDGTVLQTISKVIGTTTNNVAEYSALILAMQQALILRANELSIFTDSELVAKQYAGDYRIKDATLQVLFLFVTQLKQGFKSVTVRHVPREENRLADKEANRALDEAGLF